ncbi:hypothetical protein CHH75_10415 [Paenibacillus sp. 7541]|nr:hypothetical protein CHH75_10415 [Paenibacillus sp. 7541]
MPKRDPERYAIYGGAKIKIGSSISRPHHLKLEGKTLCFSSRLFLLCPLVVERVMSKWCVDALVVILPFPFDYYPFCSGRAAARLEAGGADKKAGKEQAARNMK